MGDTSETTAEVVDRWRPIRAGICNVWEYDHQVFDFADGRMILRGPNGSGKSNALALLFPFLIDGVMSAAAMDPFAGGRSMKSLLLGTVRDDAATTSRYRHDQRLGYVWLELERAGRHLTVGCGARATAQGDARSWFFLTDRCVGIDLDLAPDGEPLTRGRLIAELGEGAVRESAEEHRVALDRELYGLGSARLAKLVALIRVLRRPQLAGKLDLELLSTVLSDGLPAIDPAVVDDVAASFDDLEATQHALADLRTARGVIDEFLPTYLAYLRGEIALRATAVLDAARRLRRSREEVARTAARVDEVAAALDANKAARHRNTLLVEGLDGERDGILTSPAYQALTQLHELDESAQRERSHANRANQSRLVADADANDATRRAEDRAETARSADSDAERTLVRLGDAADAAGIPWTITPAEGTDPDLLQATTRTLTDARRHDMDVVTGALRAADRAAGRHHDVEAQLAKAVEAADDAEARLGDARAALDAAIETVQAQVRHWARTAPGIDSAGGDALVEAVAMLAEPGTPSLRERYSDLTADRRRSLVEQATALGLEGRSVAEGRDHASTERDRVAAEVDAGPEPPQWRSADRSGRTGAPLWACCDFAESLSDLDRSGIEAALDAAGILDAWITPGSIGAAERPVGFEHDSILVATAPEGAQATLADVLTAAPPSSSGLGTDEVAAVLRSVGLGAAGINVDRDGRFALGPIHGHAAKPTAEFIGAPARAERRRRRLAELDEQLAALDAELQRLTAAQSAVEAEIVDLDRAGEELPDAGPVASAGAATSRAEAELAARRDAAEVAAAAEADAATAATHARHRRDELATQHRCPADEDGLARLARLVDAVASAGADALDRCRGAVAARHMAKEAWELAVTATERRDQAAEAAATADRSATNLERRVEALRRQLGPDADAPLAALERVDHAIDEARAVAAELESERSALDQSIGEVREANRNAIDEVAGADTRLAASAERTLVLRRTDLLALLAPSTHDAEAPELPPEAEPFARRLLELVGDKTPAAEELTARRKALDRAAKQLLDELHHGYDPSIAHDDDVVVVEVSTESGVLPLARLATELADQQERLESYLSERDREIFEKYLLNQVAYALRRLLNDADEFVAGVNEALASARTASGLRVELDWVLGDESAAVRDAVRLLRHDTSQMGEPDRAQLRAFFDRVIREQRSFDPTIGYRAALEAALDYRRWHVFRPVLRTAEGKRSQLTRARFRELSGGEQAVALHLPLFAAAAAHYARAASYAPRLIALDEAFAGIDEAMRGELMGLVVRFDLDVIMTGHELWGAYAEVPAIAIHDLLRRPPLEGVSVVSLRWDGAALVDG